MATTPVAAPFGDPGTKTLGAGIASILIALAFTLFGIAVPKMADNEITTGSIIILVLGVVTLVAGLVTWHLRESKGKGSPFTPEQKEQMLADYDRLIATVKDPVMLAILKANREAIVDQILKSGNKLGKDIAKELDKKIDEATAKAPEPTEERVAEIHEDLKAEVAGIIDELAEEKKAEPVKPVEKPKKKVKKVEKPKEGAISDSIVMADPSPGTPHDGEPITLAEIKKDTE